MVGYGGNAPPFTVYQTVVINLYTNSRKMDSNALAVIYLSTGLRCYPEIKTSWFCFLFSIDSRIDFSFCCNQLGARGRIRTACLPAKHSVFQLLISGCVYLLTQLRAILIGGLLVILCLQIEKDGIH